VTHPDKQATLTFFLSALLEHQADSTSTSQANPAAQADRQLNEDSLAVCQVLRDLAEVLRRLGKKQKAPVLSESWSAWLKDLYAEGGEALTYQVKGVPPGLADRRTVKNILVEATAALEQFLPELTFPSTKNLTHELKEYLLSGYVQFLKARSSTQEEESATHEYLDSLANGVFERSAIAAFECPAKERRKKPASPLPQTANSQAPSP
jgi:hypothetical protein